MRALPLLEEAAIRGNDERTRAAYGAAVAACGAANRWELSVHLLGEMRHRGLQPDAAAYAAAAGACQRWWASQDVCRPADVLKLVRFFAFARRLSPERHDAAWEALRYWASCVEGDAVQNSAPSASTRGPIAFAPTSGHAGEATVVASCAHWDVVWKPAGWAVSWSVSVATDFAAIPARASGEAPPFAPDRPFSSRGGQDRDLLRWLLSGARELSEPLIRGDALFAYGVLHRLDACASGPILCARTYHGWAWACLQWAALRVVKNYTCLCHGWLPLQERGGYMQIKMRLQSAEGLIIAAPPGARGGHAVSEVYWVEWLQDCSGNSYSLVRVRPRTGRRHQLRAHLSLLGHPLVADKAYGAPQAPSWCPGILLHCHRLAIRGMPVDASGSGFRELLGKGTREHGAGHDACCKLPLDFERALEQLEPV